MNEVEGLIRSGKELRASTFGKLTSICDCERCHLVGSWVVSVCCKGEFSDRVLEKCDRGAGHRNLFASLRFVIIFGVAIVAAVVSMRALIFGRPDVLWARRKRSMPPFDFSELNSRLDVSGELISFESWWADKIENIGKDKRSPSIIVCLEWARFVRSFVLFSQSYICDMLSISGFLSFSLALLKSFTVVVNAEKVVVGCISDSPWSSFVNYFCDENEKRYVVYFDGYTSSDLFSPDFVYCHVALVADDIHLDSINSTSGEVGEFIKVGNYWIDTSVRRFSRSSSNEVSDRRERLILFAPTQLSEYDNQLSLNLFFRFAISVAKALPEYTVIYKIKKNELDFIDLNDSEKVLNFKVITNNHLQSAGQTFDELICAAAIVVINAFNSVVALKAFDNQRKILIAHRCRCGPFKDQFFYACLGDDDVDFSQSTSQLISLVEANDSNYKTFFELFSSVDTLDSMEKCIRSQI